MKKIMIPLTIALTGLFYVSNAQTINGRVSGTVTDEYRKPVESATVSLLKSVDSSIVKINATNKTGRFSFENISNGKYIVSVSIVGHQKNYSEILELTENKASVDLKTIQVLPQVRSLGSVTVTSKRPLFEQKIDRTEVNVDASITNAGTSALEVLEKSPGVTIGKDGNISLKGKQGVIVLVDGRQTYLTGADLANMLRNLNSNQLDQIEILTNPPAKFDAAGNSGVINITTKKSKLFGYNGSVTLGYGQGRYPKYNDAFNFNYRNGKINLFTTFSHNYNLGFDDLNIQRNFRDKESNQIVSSFDQQAQLKNENHSYNGKIGLDYFASKKTTLGVVFSGFDNAGTWRIKNITDISDADKKLINETRASSAIDQSWRNYSGNFNFRHAFDSTGKELRADLDLIRYKAGNNQQLINAYFDAKGNPIQLPDTLLGALPQDIKIYSAKLDYTHPLKSGERIEAGAKTSYVKTDNNAKYDSLLNGESVHDYNRSNHFIYEENISAAYVNLNKPFTKKLTGQFGLRLENTIAKGNQATTGEKFDRNYTQLFPSAFLQYKINQKNQFGLNYGRRIERPNYSDLNPFIYFLDRYTYQQGNPNLKPQFSHNIELSHTYAGFLTTTLNYTATKDIIQNVLEQNEATNETYIKKANIAQRHQYGISVSAYKQVNKWWNGNIYVNVYSNKFKGVANDVNISPSITGLLLQTQQQFRLDKNWAAEVGGFYRSKGLEGVIYTEPVGQINFGLSWQVLKSNGSIRFNVTDAFRTLEFRGYSLYSNIDTKFQERHDSRAFNISFVYRFNKGKLNANNGRKNSSASDEQNRVRAGN